MATRRLTLPGLILTPRLPPKMKQQQRQQPTNHRWRRWRSASWRRWGRRPSPRAPFDPSFVPHLSTWWWSCTRRARPVRPRLRWWLTSSLPPPSSLCIRWWRRPSARRQRTPTLATCPWRTSLSLPWRASSTLVRFEMLFVGFGFCWQILFCFFCRRRQNWLRLALYSHRFRAGTGARPKVRHQVAQTDCDHGCPAGAGQVRNEV